MAPSVSKKVIVGSAAAVAAKRAEALGASKATLWCGALAGGDGASAGRAVAEGALLAGYRFTDGINFNFPDDARLPPAARACLEGLARQFMSLHEEIAIAERRILAWHRSNEASRRLETIPGIGPITASALAASITDPALFKSGRELAAWIGLVPRQNSTGGKERMGRISKQGDHYLRWLLVTGAMAVIRYA